jgi:mono/diheme cytochrome c family protein
MNPTPPRLERAASEWTDREVFWILKHGIRLAGMPAFGPTHSDRELWALTAVVRQLPELSAEEYQRLTAASASGGEQGGHGADGHPH